MSTTATTGGELPEVWGRIVEAIAAGPTAWKTPREVASAIGLDEEETLDELASMDVAGLLDLWERPEGIAVTLSVLSADRFGLRLVEDGPKLLPRWAREGEPDPPPVPAYRVFRSAEAARFDFLVDPRPGPDSGIEQSERAGQFRENGLFGTIRKGAGRGEPPRPTLLIGLGLAAWPGPNSGETPQCPACGSGVLPPHAYCLCCDRWGLDGPNATAPRPGGIARSPGATGFRNPDDRGDASDRERQRRRDRRRSKMAARVARQRSERAHRRDDRRGGPH